MPRTVVGELLAWLWWIAAAVAVIGMIPMLTIALVDPDSRVPALAATAIHLALAIALVVGRRLVRRARLARARNRGTLPGARLVRR